MMLPVLQIGLQYVVATNVGELVDMAASEFVAATANLVYPREFQDSRWYGLMAIAGIVSGVLFLVACSATRTKIVLHPKNAIWEPSKFLNKRTRYKFIYRSLNELIHQKANKPYVLIPIADDFAVYLCENKKHLKDNDYRFLTCSNRQIIESLANKVSLSNHVLQEYLPESYSIENVVYPCVLKYNKGGFSTGVFKINNEVELKEKTIGKQINQDYIIQEAILDKREYSTQFLVHDGKIVFHASYYDEYENRLFIWPHVKSTRRVGLSLDENDAVFQVFEKFLVEFNGLINCNYKLQDGGLKILEFNARLSGDIYGIDKRELNELIGLYWNLCFLVES